MKNKKGFTLVELLAVIVVLGVIMTIAGTAVLTQKRKANQKEVESIYNDIKSFGPDVYLEEKISGKYYFDVNYLKEKGYLKSNIQNPAGGGDCDAYLLIDTANKEDMFDAYVDCPGLKPHPENGTNPTTANSGYTKKQ